MVGISTAPAAEL
ncbi:rCG57075 [Rattus norvegicus]|uniref:RCG57075 n=1 Tax=Rattus norvegicus TaxID=10116 RepID=A6JD99_RAT|nr:rCG57075 [Rattus norvegicus]